MKTLEISPLTPENFRIFGSYSQMVEPTAPGGGVNGMSFHPDMEILELGNAHAAAFSVTRVTSQLEPVITVLEQHGHCGEGILSLDHDMYVYFAPAFYTAEQAGAHLVAFRVPAGVMLTIRPGVWHCMPFPVDSEVIHVLNVLPDPRPQDMEPGYLRLFLRTAGADSPRPIKLRQKPSTGEWFLWEYSSPLSGIRIPAAQDPWA